MNIATLGVAIDPTQAQAGAAAANRAMASMGTQAQRTTQQVQAAGQAAGAAAARGGQQQAQAHESTLSRMAQSIRGFFGQANQSAQQTSSLFGGMVGKLVGFLQNVLSMVPGATGVLAGMVGMLGDLAKSLVGLAQAGSVSTAAQGRAATATGDNATATAKYAAAMAAASTVLAAMAQTQAASATVAAVHARAMAADALAISANAATAAAASGTMASAAAATAAATGAAAAHSAALAAEAAATAANTAAAQAATAATAAAAAATTAEAAAATGAAAANTTLASSFNALALAVLPLVALLVTVTAGLVALAAAAAVTWKAIGRASEAEQTEVQFLVLIGNVEKARKAMADLREFADKTPFDTRQVMNWGAGLLNAGVTVDQLTHRLTILGNSSMGNAEKMDAAMRAYNKTLSGGIVQQEELNSIVDAQIPIMEALADVVGVKSVTALKKLISDGTVGADKLTAAFQKLGGEGGRLGTMMEKASKTWEGRISTIASRWDNLLVVFGTPIKDALMPALDAVDQRLQAMIPTAQSIGETVAGAIIDADWDRVQSYLTARMGQAGESIGKALGDAVKNGLMDAWKEAVRMFQQDIQDLRAAFPTAAAVFDVANYAAGEVVKRNSPPPQQGPTQPPKAPSPATLAPGDTIDLSDLWADQLQGPGLEGVGSNAEVAAAIQMHWQATGRDNKGKHIDWSDLREPAKRAGGGGSGGSDAAGSSKKADEFHGDAYLMREFFRELRQMQGLMNKGQMSQKEFNVRSEKSKDALAGQLGDPRKYQEALGQWRVFQAEKARTAEETTRRIQSGEAGMFESFNSGVQQAAQNWGNAQQQMAKLGEGVANSISTNMSQALTDIATGAKDAKTAFRDMAVAILADIAKMIIQMLVELAIQYALNAARGFAGGGQVGGTNTMGELQYATNSVPKATAVGYATGGQIAGGAGGIDDIPAMLTAGEYVMRREAVQKYGVGFMEQLNQGRVRKYATGGGVTPMAPAQGGGSGAGTAGSGVNVNVAVDARGGGNDDDDPATKKRKSEQLGRAIEASVRTVIQNEQRAGGLLSKR